MSPATAAPSRFPRSGGPAADLIRAVDWARTPLGPVSGWPAALKATIEVILRSRYPMFIWWGEDLIQFYNDAYIPSFGEGKHPAAMGQPGRQCWTEIWPVIGPQIEGVMTTGEATWNEDALVPISRNRRIEEVYWTYGYSPILEDGSAARWSCARRPRRASSRCAAPGSFMRWPRCRRWPRIHGAKASSPPWARLRSTSRSPRSSRRTARSRARSTQGGVAEHAGLVGELHATHQDNDERLATLGHELRTALSPIETAIETIRLRGDDPAEPEHQVIAGQIAQLLRRLDDLRAGSKGAR